VYKNARRLLTFIGAVNGRPAKILIDGGAEGNVISTTFCKQNNIPLEDSTPIPIILPNGSASLSHYTASPVLKRDSYSANVQAIVYPLKKYDVIALGGQGGQGQVEGAITDAVFRGLHACLFIYVQGAGAGSVGSSYSCVRAVGTCKSYELSLVKVILLHRRPLSET
jgi:hypothetical protein